MPGWNARWGRAERLNGPGQVKVFPIPVGGRRVPVDGDAGSVAVEIGRQRRLGHQPEGVGPPLAHRHGRPVRASGLTLRLVLRPLIQLFGRRLERTPHEVVNPRTEVLCVVRLVTPCRPNAAQIGWTPSGSRESP